MNIIVKAPDKTSKGYMRRDLARLEFVVAAARLSEKDEGENPTAQETENLLNTQKKFVEHILQFVVEPKDKDAAREALLDASEDEFWKLANMTRGEANNAGKPPLESVQQLPDSKTESKP